MTLALALRIVRSKKNLQITMMFFVKNVDKCVNAVSLFAVLEQMDDTCLLKLRSLSIFIPSNLANMVFSHILASPISTQICSH